MRNTILAATAALALALTAAPGFAAQQNRNNQPSDSPNSSSNINSQCANILANPAGHAQRDVEECRAQQ